MSTDQNLSHSETCVNHIVSFEERLFKLHQSIMTNQCDTNLKLDAYENLVRIRNDVVESYLDQRDQSLEKSGIVFEESDEEIDLD